MLTSTAFFAQSQTTNFGNLRLHAGATMSFFGDFKNNGTVKDSGQTVAFDGTTNQKILGTSSTTFNYLKINNAIGITLQQNITITQTLTLNSGALDLNKKTLTISNSKPYGISRTSGNIISDQTDNSSKITWAINAKLGTYIYPFATVAGTYIPFTLTTTAGIIGNVTVSTYPTASNNTPFPSSPTIVSNVNKNGVDNSVNLPDRFWEISKDGVSGTANVTFTTTPDEIGGIANLGAQHWNSALSKWDVPISGQTNTATSATVYGVTSFSPWTLFGNYSPLPIELVSFSAKIVDQHAEIIWTTSTEHNNDFFTLEKSSDAVNFDVDTIIDGAGFSIETLNYKATDFEPLLGKSFYRLKQTDFDGNFTYSDLKSVDFDRHTHICISPNPFKEGDITILFHHIRNDNIGLEIVNMVGELCFSSKYMIEDLDSYETEINEFEYFTKGIYVFKITIKDKTFIYKVIKL